MQELKRIIVDKTNTICLNMYYVSLKIEEFIQTLYESHFKKERDSGTTE